MTRTRTIALALAAAALASTLAGGFFMARRVAIVRGAINPEEQDEIQLGGGGLPRDNKVATIVAAKNKYIFEHSLEEWEEEMRAHHGGHLPEDASWISSCCSGFC